MTFEADANSYEAAAERKAEQKLLFHPCRRWYADKRNVRLQAAHGLFPAMWMELEAWAGWKSVRKEYLKFQDTGEWAGAAPAAAPAAAPPPRALANAPHTAGSVGRYLPKRAAEGGDLPDATAPTKKKKPKPMSNFDGW